MAGNSTNFYRKAPPDRGASSFVYPPTGANLDFFAEALRAGCVVAIPTETVYGLAALALNADFCRSIFDIKGRPLMDPLIVHVSDMAMAADLAEIPHSLEMLKKAFWPGPLTVILKKRKTVPDIVTAGKDTVALRMPNHSVARDLLSRLGAPLAAPSANPFGYVSPTKAAHVSASFGAKVPFIIDGGPCNVGLESTILDLSEPEKPAVLRPGAISVSSIADVLGIPVFQSHTVSSTDSPAKSPGTLARHYSPRTTLSLFEENPPAPTKKEAIIFLRRPDSTSEGMDNIFWFSETGDPLDIAQSLFDLIRSLDQQGYRKIHCQVPERTASGLLFAVRDRLLRAATKG